ncbi:hypothetical protein [Prosthecobacter sp.]|uniref:hypothetical protein n=1 Tax=Prosthecobacter sp. TaxID=1965333 RepID=UPI0037849F77
MPFQTKIDRIKVENVRGIASSTMVFDSPEMLGNKFHLLVAPNGFGKSSLATAFVSLTPKNLKLTLSQVHQNDEAKKPKLEITFTADGVQRTLRADNEINEISKVFSISVLNSRTKPAATAKRSIMNQYARPTASLIIEPVVLVKKIPNCPEKSFKTSDFKRAFGKAGKILPNIQPFLENAKVLKIILSLPQIANFGRKKVWKTIDPIIAEINAQKGGGEELVAWVEQNCLARLEAVIELAAIADYLIGVLSITRVESILLAYQFAKAYAQDSNLLKNHLSWYTYLCGKKKCEELIRSVNSNPAWIDVSIEELDGALVVMFPDATKMSNGQRDLLSFVAQLMKAEFDLVSARAILVVDEIFDYLDECNLLAAQYYISKFIDNYKSSGAEIFPLFLTHLDPSVFRHSALGLGKKDIRKIHVLDKASDSSRTKGVAPMIRLRDDAQLKDYVGKHFLHYHPSNCDQVALFRSKGLKETWGKSHAFYKYVFTEFKNYRSGAVEADHVAACVALRIAIEKHAFDQISPVDQKRFTDEFKKGTAEKLDFVESVGGEVPESHRLLGLLYNDIVHHKDYDYISAIVSKMKNPAIRGMMNEIPVPSSF